MSLIRRKISLYTLARQGLLTLLCILFIGAGTATRADNIRLPDIGASADSMMTRAEEERLGRQFMRSIRRSMPVADDPLLVEYVEGLGERISSQTALGSGSFRYFLIEQPVINAFAGPAGHIGIYSGLILATEGESELASVVAHETAHVTQSHLTRAFENASQMSGPMAALLLAAVLLGATVSSDVGIAAAAGVQAAAVQQQLNFTRANEEEADRVGIQLLAQADFDPHAMPSFFERLAKASRLYENNAPEFLRTHPVTTNRIADARGRADDFPYRQYPDTPDYFLVRAMLREKEFKNAQDAVKHFANTLADGRHRQADAERYAYALALTRNRQVEQAAKEIKKLLDKAPDHIAYIYLSARIDAERGNTGQALEHLEKALALYPGNYPLSVYYAELTLATAPTDKTAKVLDDALLRRPSEPALYQLRSRVAQALGQNAEAHLFLADAHYLNGQLESAAQQLEVALRNKDFAFIESARMQAKLKQIKEELKAEKAAREK